MPLIFSLWNSPGAPPPKQLWAEIMFELRERWKQPGSWRTSASDHFVDKNTESQSLMDPLGSPLWLAAESAWDQALRSHCGFSSLPALQHHPFIALPFPFPVTPFLLLRSLFIATMIPSCPPNTMLYDSEG